MDKKGQALIEFVIVMPVFLLVVMGMIDFGNIIYQKYNLENQLDHVTNLYEAESLDKISSYTSQNKISSNVTVLDDYATIVVTKQIKVTTPGLNLILGNPHKIEAKRIIYEK